MNKAPPDSADLYRRQVREMRKYAMFTIDADGILTSWNAGVQDLMGYSEQEWLGRHACMIFSPAEKAQEICDAEMRKARENGDVTDIRWHRHKDGSEFFANGFLSAIRDSNGQLIGYSKIMSDETARKSLQDSLTESNTALEQFAYAASHDLQEPLRTMSAYAQLLSRQYGGKLDGEADRMLQFIVSASSRMTSLVRDLLEYARFTTEEGRPDSVAIDEDLEAAISHLDEAIQESGATVTHDPMPVLQVDRGQIVRLFQNLIGNAIKYRKPEQRPEVHITAEQKGAEWVISVRDNGIGFEPSEASKIFEPFKRLHSAADIPGTGVGLAICRRIVHAQGGRIWAESQPGQGATFHFTLPVSGS
ncbi:MAG TPA: ATP-binding protein [Candidatus Solibacter sp.]|jgi:PAS domain S-box-containing protein